MKTKYDIGDQVLIKAKITESAIKNKNRIIYGIEVHMTNDNEYLLAADEKDIRKNRTKFNGCDNCKYDRVPMTAYPCSDCEHNHISHYEPKEDEDEDNND